MLSSVYKWHLFFIASHPVFAVNNTIQYNTVQQATINTIMLFTSCGLPGMPWQKENLSGLRQFPSFLELQNLEGFLCFHRNCNKHFI